MEDIKVGEYVKLNNGKIGKTEAIEKGSIMLDIVSNRWVGICCISKHSSNIIDLIEVGDIVEIVKGYGEKGTILYHMIDEQYKNSFTRSLKIEYIKSIATHEQFESIKYEI